MTMMVRRKSNALPRAKRQDAVAAGSPALSTQPPEPGSWEYMFRMLTIFIRTHGHCEVPYTPRRDSLGYWVMQQRMAHLAGTLTPQLHERLENLGLQFDLHDPTESARERRWNEKFDALQAFKKREGHCRVPCRGGEFLRLYQWIAVQRRLYVTEKLRRDRRDRLVAIGVELERSKRGKTRSRGPGRHRVKWDQRFRELTAFQTRFGHCFVPRGWPENPELANWIANQRQFMVAGRIDAGCRELLTKLGVVPGPGKKRVGWNGHYEALLAYKARHGDCNVPSKYAENLSLGIWVTNQRSAFAQDKLPPERRRLLEEAGFVLRRERSRDERSRPDTTARWEKHFAALVAFRDHHGHCHPDPGDQESKKVFRWVQYQRAERRVGRMSDEHLRRLDDLGFAWQGQELARRWERRFAALTAFHRQHGHCDIPYIWPENQNLFKWLALQRRLLHRGTLPKNRADRLLALGVQPAARELIWEKRYAELTAFHRAHGHCSVPDDWQGSRSLCVWVAGQRKLHRQRRLDPRHRALLEKLNFPWELQSTTTFSNERRWKQMCAAFRAFRQEHGHGLVSIGNPAHRALARWCHRMRGFWKTGTLPTERIRELEENGFAFDVADAGWQLRLQELTEWRKAHGHCHVTRGTDGFSVLGAWVCTQRKLRGQGQLSEQRIRQLDDLGFDWDPYRREREADWESCFLQLAEFHRDHGHCRVPTKQCSFQRLYRWLNRQREFREEGKLSSVQIVRLDALGFDWQGRITRTWDENFALLVEAKRVHGTCHVPKSANPSLHHWLDYQQKRQLAGTLPAEQRARLDSLGLNWEATPGTSSPDARHQTPQDTPPEVSP